ncbi:hypothetical protein ACH5A2_26695 [Streptomyces collinus]|uniref:hypothetical protein n=1 Tax=Streptomyces collinus TaxID=42684 RepID=UPI0037AD334D
MADHLEHEEPSRVAGAVVLAALGGGALAVVFALAVEAGVLTVWVAAVAAVWWSARRRVSDSSATPPPQPERPSCRECAGHELVDVTPSETQKGMLIYKSAPPDRPNHTHIHIVEEVNPR